MSDGLADTSLFIASESGRALDVAALPDRLAVSVITIGELRAGVLAARLAARGYTGATDAIEHATGFLRAHSASGAADVSATDMRLGAEWRLDRTGVNALGRDLVAYKPMGEAVDDQ